MPEQRRFAAIDVGSNGIRCVIVEVAEDRTPRVLEAVREPIRLGTRVFLTGQIGEEVANQTREAFHVFRRIIDGARVETIRAVATSAVREAEDGPALVRTIEEETGISIRVIDAAEEAHLVLRAVGSRLDLGNGRTTMVDVGGGSVEVVLLDGGDVVRSESFALGAVRLLQALQGPSAGQDAFSLLEEYVGAIRARVRTALGDAPITLYAATGGSAETLADLAGEKVSSHPALGTEIQRIHMDRLRQQVVELSSRSYLERIRDFNLREDRADVILPASVVYLTMGEVFGTEWIYVPGVGLKDGLVLDMIDELERTGALKSRRRELRSAALGMGRRYGLDVPHAEKVTDLALSLFDQLGDLHGLGDEERTLLEAAALLHDVGVYVSTAGHHKHSHYLISQSDIVGLDRRQREIVANVARYHRKSGPSKKHLSWASLQERDRETVRRLAAILRVADVLDREHRQRVKALRAVETDDGIELQVETDDDLLLERWAAAEKFAFFKEVFDRVISLSVVQHG